MKITRRRLVQAIGGLSGLGVSASLGRGLAHASGPSRRYDVAIIGGGVFGIWSAERLHRAGLRVCVVDRVAPAHSRASSGGETRVIRAGYGDKEIYTEWAWRSLGAWQALSDRAGLPLFRPLGVLWLHRRPDELVAASTEVLARHGIPWEILGARELRSRYPVLRVADDEAGFLEPAAGGLMARRAVQFLAAELAADGVEFIGATVQPTGRGQGENGLLRAVTTTAGERIEAGQFVFSCGPWLDRVCPEAMAGRLFVTRQEVFYFGVPAGATGALPVWADLPFYGFPDIEGRGFKVADDTHGPPLDPDTADRRASAEGELRAREFLVDRFPTLAEAPLTESRVCQYENSAEGHFVIDRHPGLDNAWIVGGGSGHGFKHGPAVGEHVAALVTGAGNPREPFLLASQGTRQERGVQ